MSQKQPPPLLFMETYDKINAHLADKWTQSHLCPVCGRNDWHVQSGDTLQFTVQAPDTGYFEPSGRLAPTFIVICRNCYVYRNFLMAPVVEEDDNG